MPSRINQFEEEYENLSNEDKTEINRTIGRYKKPANL